MRRTGQTTRLIDEAIQIIFSGQVWIAKDHYMNGTEHKANFYLFKGVVKRLENEHGLLNPKAHDQFKLDYKQLTIKLEQE